MPLVFAESNPRIELIENSQLVKLLNEYLGTTWFSNLYLIMAERIRKEKDIAEQS